MGVRRAAGRILELLEVAMAQRGTDLGAVTPVVALLATLPKPAAEPAYPSS
jgi:hypothetical protein